MTCKERHMKERPHDDIAWVISNKCPSTYGYLEDPAICNGCDACWNRECDIPETKDLPNTSTPRIKIFSSDSNNHLEFMVNSWLEDNPGIEILDIKFQEAGDYYHKSICILYKEVKAE